jgi:hypothetical protein
MLTAALAAALLLVTGTLAPFFMRTLPTLALGG